MAFHERLRIAMSAKGIKNPTALADLMSVPKQTAYRWCDGTNEKLEPINLFKLADVLGVSSRWLVDGKTPPYGRRVKSIEQDDLITTFDSLPKDKQQQVLEFAEALALMAGAKLDTPHDVEHTRAQRRTVKTGS